MEPLIRQLLATTRWVTRYTSTQMLVSSYSRQGPRVAPVVLSAPVRRLDLGNLEDPAQAAARAPKG